VLALSTSAGASVAAYALGGPWWAAVACAAAPLAALAASLASRVASAEAEAGAQRARARDAEDLLAGASHELRTPLNAILGYSELLVEDASARAGATGELGRWASELEVDLGRVNHSARHLAALVDEVLDLSRAQRGAAGIRLEEADASELVTEAAESLEALVGAGSNELVVDAPPSLGVVEVDRTMVRRVVLNLVSNASKFTEGGRVTVRASLEEDAGSPGAQVLRVEVEDTGRGMTEEQVRLAFGEFVQVHGGRPEHAHAHAGSGLGLALSRRACALMGGRIGATSAPGEGSTFWFEVPARRAPAGAGR